MKKMKRNIIVVVFGVSSDLTVFRFGSNGKEKLMYAKIPWAEIDGKMYWPTEWLFQVLSTFAI